MTLAVGKAAYPDYPQQPGQQPPPPQVVVPLGVGGPLGGYLQQAPPYEQHHHHVLHHPQPLAVGAVGTPPPSSPSAAAANAANNCCCPTSSSSSSSPSSGSSAASSRRGSRSSRSSRSGDEGGGGDGSVAWYCCCCCASSPRSARRRRSVLASVGVCVLVLVYTLLGALAFTALEGSGFRGGPSPPVSRASATGGVGGSTPAHDELRIKTVEKLWSITEDLNILYKDNWTRLAAQEVLRFQDMLVENIKSGAVLNSAPTAAPAGKDGKDAAAVAKATSVTTAASTYQAGPHASHRWTFPSSFLYSLTLITTIGYGSVSPRTTWGRLVSIFYAIIGIPLMLLYLSTTGESLARSFRRAYGRMCTKRGSKASKSKSSKSAKQSGKAAKGAKGKASKAGGAVISSGKAPAATSSMKAHQAHLGLALGTTDELTLKADRAMIVVDCGAGDGVGLSAGASGSEPPPPPPPPVAARVPVLLCLLVLLLYVGAGAFLFHYLEGWTLVEGSYFCFTTLGTIGFGDLIPGRGGGGGRAALRGWRGELASVAAASAYILLGMALVAMTFSLVQDEFISLLRRLGRQCSSRPATGPHSPHPRPRPSCSDSESNTEPAGASLSACDGGGAASAGCGGEALALAVVSSS